MKKNSIDPNELKVYWNYNTQVTPLEFLKRLAPLVTEPVQNMWELEGDFYFSDFQKLNEASHRFTNAMQFWTEQEKKEEEDEEVDS
jgi:hypothetical protein